MKNFLILFLLSGLLLSSCDNDHFISDRAYRNKVKEQFEITRKLAANRNEQLFGVFGQSLKLKEKEALEFLYAYMPLSDLADYDGNFFLQNVRASFAARDTFAWGKMIPENIFRHFVLPVRVNNENLDSSRIVFFYELKGRIKNMTLKEAALEVNHWCHEKVTYKGSDARTSSPLASVKTAYGRCGEESTFTVAAMRSVCIPARQCYTPRWAHTDDNHAWVEVWVDGKWHYLGACEPEPELDMGWFSAPAKRAMLVNTNVFGDYEGPEDVLQKDQRFTRINVLPNYTKTKRIFVKVTDSNRKPVDSAVVEFQLYNYAEFYPLSRSVTGKDGLCSFLTGYGDLLIWAAKDNLFTYRKISVKNTDTLDLVPEMKPEREYTTTFDLVPPPAINIRSDISDSARAENDRRFAFEDKIRGNYEKTFIDSSKSHRFASIMKIDPDSLWDILKKSRGNYREIIDFVSSVPADKKEWIFPLLNSVSEKDLRDIDPEVLSDLINTLPISVPGYNKWFYAKYVLNPRVDNEFLKPYRKFLIESFDETLAGKIKKDPVELVKWMRTNLIIDKQANYGKAPLTPSGVFNLKVTDEHSRDIFFVAVCRSLGIPSQLEPSTLIPQVFLNGKWKDMASTGSTTAKDAVEGTGNRSALTVKTDKTDPVPGYYTHYTIERFSDGFYRSLDYENDPSVGTFPYTINVIPGSYMVVTGRRLEDGTVLSRLDFFNAGPGKSKEVKLVFRKEPETRQVSSLFIKPADLFRNINIQDLSGGKAGTIMAWLDPEKEPSRHFIAELILKKNEFRKWDGRIYLLFKTEDERKIFLGKNGNLLPSNCQTLTKGTESLSVFRKMTDNQVGSDLPVVTFFRNDGTIEYLSSGYKIGSVEEILNLIK